MTPEQRAAIEARLAESRRFQPVTYPGDAPTDIAALLADNAALVVERDEAVQLFDMVAVERDALREALDGLVAVAEPWIKDYDLPGDTFDGERFVTQKHHGNDEYDRRIVVLDALAAARHALTTAGGQRE